MKIIDVSPTMKNIVMNKYKRKQSIKPLNMKIVETNTIKNKFTNYNYLKTFIKFNKTSYLYEIDPINLLSPINYDIFIKYIYLKNPTNRFHKNMYINHIKAFNNFKEPDGSKNNKNDFINSCNNFINNNNCPDTIIPISKQKIIIDGSHRVANSIIKKHKTLCCEFDTEDLFFDFNFFLKRGFKRKYCDYIGFTIIDLVKNITFLKIHFTNKKQYHEKLEKLNNEYEVYYYIKKKNELFALLATNNKDNFIYDKEIIKKEYSKYIRKSILKKYKGANIC